tara:strand:- start:846 stop:1100 length:255 start_codon:yes stop_codon:yes gene_type:complete
MASISQGHQQNVQEPGHIHGHIHGHDQGLGQGHVQVHDLDPGEGHGELQLRRSPRLSQRNPQHSNTENINIDGSLGQADLESDS